MTAPGAWLSWGDAQPDPAFQGIEYLDLELRPSPRNALSAVLTVYLSRSTAGITDRSFAIRGGRDTTVSGTIVSKSDTPPQVVLQLDRVGDQAPYTLVLLEDAGAPIHPFFGAAEFVFTIDCPRGDCRPSPLQAPRRLETPPAVDLAAKDYQGFLQLLAERVRVTNPHWVDLSPASFERVMIELLAHHADHLSYYQDRVANEAFLDDASQRWSIRQHGVLLDYRLSDGNAATTDLALEVRRDGFLPAGLSFRMHRLDGEARVVFHLTEGRPVRADHSRLTPAAWPGAFDAELPAGATRMLLWGKVDGLVAGQRVAFAQGGFSQVVSVARAVPTELVGWRRDPADQSPPALVELTILEWREPLARAFRPFARGLPFALHGNVLPARHGEERLALLNGDTSRPIPRNTAELQLDRQRAVVTEEPRAGGSVRMLRAIKLPDAPVLHAPAGAGEAYEGELAPLVEVVIAGESWFRVEHLLGSAGVDRHYVATADEDGALWLLFGDGVQGRAVELIDSRPPGPEILVRYRVGEPISGNCAPGAVTETLLPPEGTPAGLLVEQAGIMRVTNVTGGAGGRQPETLDTARIMMPAALRRGPLRRAVTLEDYAAVTARQVPGVARAAARTLGGVFNTVLVLVDPEGQVELTQELEERVERHLDVLRMAGREVVVAGPEYVPLSVKLAVCAQPGALSHRVRETVYAALRPGTRERRGFFHPDELSFGDDIELGDVLAAVQRLPGVRSVKALEFKKLRVLRSPDVVQRIVLGPTEVARLDGDDDRPELGRLEVLMVGVDDVNPNQFQFP